ncbi:relaxase/mobilization nuclease domain-containing protein, partial [Cnuella takakiae]
MSFPKRLHDALNYNEQKVAKGVAHLLQASGYLCKPMELSYYQKAAALELRNSLAEKATSQTIHISLNFSPQDRQLDAAMLISIARDYMQGIGFGKQPYLVYQHQDAGHPHLHIVSTTIQKDGSRIPTHNLGKVQSSKMRVELEAKYNLVPARGRTLPEAVPSILGPQPAQCGKEETRAAIARVVNYVFRQYAFNSLPQYNAALGQYGIVADGGTKESRVHRHGGLLYRMLDAQGNKTGVPIKASLLPGKPTLKALEAKFKFAAKQKELALPMVVRKVEGALNSSTNLQQFTQALKLAGIYTLPRSAGNG